MMLFLPVAASYACTQGRTLDLACQTMLPYRVRVEAPSLLPCPGATRRMVTDSDQPPDVGSNMTHVPSKRALRSERNGSSSSGESLLSESLLRGVHGEGCSSSGAAVVRLYLPCGAEGAPTGCAFSFSRFL